MSNGRDRLALRLARLVRAPPNATRKTDGRGAVRKRSSRKYRVHHRGQLKPGTLRDHADELILRARLRSTLVKRAIVRVATLVEGARFLAFAPIEPAPA